MSRSVTDLSWQPRDAFFWKYANPEPNTGCWLWSGAGDEKGYGFVRSRGANYRAHRLAWEILRSPIPDGLTIDHLCKVKCCVNPDHMEVVSSVENTLRAETWSGRNSRRTACPSGHPYVGDNIKWQEGRRYCRECQRKYGRERGRRLRREARDGKFVRKDGK